MPLKSLKQRRKGTRLAEAWTARMAVFPGEMAPESDTADASAPVTTLESGETASPPRPEPPCLRRTRFRRRESLLRTRREARGGPLESPERRW